MRRIALYSDVHGNTVALHAVHEQMQQAGISERYCLGDLVGLGPCPNEAVLAVRSFGDGVVQGNYDRAIGLHLNSPGSEFPTTQEALDGAESYAFTVSEVSGEAARYLHALPIEIHLQHEGARILLCHGTPRKVNGIVEASDPPGHVSGLVREAGVDVVCAGHTHAPFHRALPALGGVLHWVNVGSVGRPRDGDPRAAWVELVLGEHAEVVARAPVDLACRRIGGTDVWLGVLIHRVPYDVDAVLRDMLLHGLPQTLAAALKTGLEEHDVSPTHERPSAEARVTVTEVPVPEESSELPCGHSRSTCGCLFDDRTATYDALARLYRGDISEAAAAVRRLRVAMRGSKVSRHVDEAAILEAYEGADRAFRTAAGREAFEIERERLFGLRTGFDPFVNVLSAHEVTYLSGDVYEHMAAIEATYAEASFVVPESAASARIPDHISTELSFMAHCLRGASAGDARALTRAQEFFTKHLAEWAVLFAVVVGQQAREPVTRYAGLALDKHLTCEGSMFRVRVPKHDELLASAKRGPDESVGGGVLSFRSRRR